MVAISAPIAATAMPAPATARRAGSKRATEYAAINAGIRPEKNDAIAPVKICDSENVPDDQRQRCQRGDPPAGQRQRRQQDHERVEPARAAFVALVGHPPEPHVAEAVDGEH